MKALLGVDVQGLYHAGSRLFRRLEFDAPQVELVTVIEPPAASNEAEEHTSEGILTDLQSAAARELRAANADFPGAPATTLYGNAESRLIDQAADTRVDLICAGTERKDAFTALFFGSVTRALTSRAHQSVLVGKQPVRDVGKLKVVIATDHSEYANRAIDRVFEFAPHGIAHATILTATPLIAGMAADMVNGIPVLLPSDADWSHKRIHTQHEVLRSRLDALCIESRSKIVECHPNIAIEEAIQEDNAELVILGAQGHGFLSRLLLGSISFHQVVATPNSVLVLRA